MAESQDLSKTRTFRKGQEQVTPELRKEGDYQPHQGNVNPSNGIAGKHKPSTSIVPETQMPESGPGPPSSTQLVSGIPKKLNPNVLQPTPVLQSTPVLQGQASILPPELPHQSTPILPGLEVKPPESLPKPPESEPQGMESQPTLPEPGTKPHPESPPTLPESESEPIESPPTLPESESEPIESLPTLPESESELIKSPPTLPESESKPIESPPTLPESESEPIESLPTLTESESELIESPPTLTESESELIESPPTLPESESEPIESPPALLESKPELIESFKIHYSENKTSNINPANPSWDSYQTYLCYSSPHSIYSPNYMYIRRMDNTLNEVDEYLTRACQTISQSYLGDTCISNAQSIDNCIVYKSRSTLESGEQRFPEKLVTISYRDFKTQDVDVDDASTDTE